MPQPLAMELRPVSWPLRAPLVIARCTHTTMEALQLRLVAGDGHTGQAESAGVDYRGETPASIAQALEPLREQLHDGLDAAAVQHWLPPGGARHLLDAALWDLQAKRQGRRVWQLLGAAPWRPVTTAVTIGICDEPTLRRRLDAWAGVPLLKLKLDAEHHADVVRIARERRPDARLTVDCNGGLDRALLERLLPVFADCRVELIEQPLPAGCDGELDGLRSPIPIAADESCDTADDLARLLGRFQAVNIKLEKTGGLTAALALADAAQRAGLATMVGTMGGSSLAMAPSFALAGRCRWVDLDTPLLLAADHGPPLRYGGGRLCSPDPQLWG